MSQKKLFLLLYVAVGTSTILGPSLVWLLTSNWCKTMVQADKLYAEFRLTQPFLSAVGVDRGQLFPNLQSVLALNGDSVPSTTDRESISVRSRYSDEPNTVQAERCRWVNQSRTATLNSKPRYFLTAVVLLRIYKDDKANLTTRELKQWLLYMKYIGVEHVYLYDAFYNEDEAQARHIGAFLSENYVTYIDWHMHNPYTISGTQVTAYQHCIDNFGSVSTWQTAIDIDEYPFSPVDKEPYFLARYLNNISKTHTRSSEVLMENFLFLGKPLHREFLIERLWRRDKERSNRLVKPIYKPANVQASVHRNRLLRGISIHADEKKLRMNHYWGARLQNWGEDTPEILKITKIDRGMEKVVKSFRDCEVFIRPYL